jgi:phosphoglycerate dehydrogenase-like enzyme
MPRVVVFNLADQAAHLAVLVADLPVEVRHADFRLPWEVIADRRAGKIGDAHTASPEVRALLGEAEVILGFALPYGAADLAPRLRWVETPATGHDQLNGTGVLEGGAAVTTIGGVFAPPVAEHVFALLLALWRRMDEFRDAQRRRAWELKVVRGLGGSTMLIVGLGNIGGAVARAAKAFGMRVLGIRRDVRLVPEGVDAVHPRERLHALLGEADVVVLAVAGTPDTVHLIGAPELAAMKPDACLINVARGIVLDEGALAAALAGGRIGGAGLDVFESEPLPAASPLWTMPNVVITPHIAPNTESKMRLAVDHFADNLRRYCAGEELVDRVR